MLQSPNLPSLFGVITDFLASDRTPEEIIAYRLPPDLEARAHELLDRNTEGELSPDEIEEMNDFVRVEQMMSLLKAKTRLKLKRAAE